MTHPIDRLVGAAAASALFALFGAVFGGIAGGVARLSGRAPGGLFGNALARALGRHTRRDLLRLSTGVLIGATDGAFFLAVVGLILGAALSYTDRATPLEVLAPPLLSVVLLGLGACVFGGLAWVFLWGGLRVVGLIFGVLAGIIVGRFLEVRLAVVDATLYGLLVGLALGLVAAVFAPSRYPAAVEKDSELDEVSRLES